jgi:predicted enzyme related to lactoylglutathione lyase
MSAGITFGLDDLSCRIRSEHPEAGVSCTSLPSGAAVLDLHYRERFYVLAFSPARGFAVDEVLPGEGFLNQYRFVYQDLEQAAAKLMELAFGDSELKEATDAPQLNLIVVYASDPDQSKRFYETLGLTFSSEKHGRGPAHYASRTNATIFEIYPRSDGHAPGPLRIGFQVAGLDAILEDLQRLPAQLVTPPQNTPWGRRAVVHDPDGYVVELSSPV